MIDRHAQRAAALAVRTRLNDKLTARETLRLFRSFYNQGREPDEVILPSLTFVSTLTAVLHSGARPVLVDIDPENLGMDPAAFERAITPSTKAVVPVHLYGQLCDMPSLAALARERGLKIVEDAAHCVEGERDGVDYWFLTPEEFEARVAEFMGKKYGVMVNSGSSALMIALRA